MGSEPLAREPVERRVGLDVDLAGWRRRAPDSAADVGEDVLQFILGACSIPTVLGGAESDVAALAVRAEAQGMRRAPRGALLDDCGGRRFGHQFCRGGGASVGRIIGSLGAPLASSAGLQARRGPPRGGPIGSSSTGCPEARRAERGVSPSTVWSWLRRVCTSCARNRRRAFGPVPMRWPPRSRACLCTHPRLKPYCLATSAAVRSAGWRLATPQVLSR
jgi:hypothetical protein